LFELNSFTCLICWTGTAGVIPERFIEKSWNIGRSYCLLCEIWRNFKVTLEIFFCGLKLLTAKSHIFSDKKYAAAKGDYI